MNADVRSADQKLFLIIKLLIIDVRQGGVLGTFDNDHAGHPNQDAIRECTEAQTVLSLPVSLEIQHSS